MHTGAQEKVHLLVVGIEPRTFHEAAFQPHLLILRCLIHRHQTLGNGPGSRQLEVGCGGTALNLALEDYDVSGRSFMRLGVSVCLRAWGRLIPSVSGSVRAQYWSPGVGCRIPLWGRTPAQANGPSGGFLLKHTQACDPAQTFNSPTPQKSVL